MARLVEICEALGYEDVWTYVNSGNAVFDAAGSRAAIEVSMETRSRRRWASRSRPSSAQPPS
ncbi:hypothetical protein BH18ACT3_BH18ACT3_25280 [soil metagenome]